MLGYDISLTGFIKKNPNFANIGIISLFLCHIEFQQKTEI
jgi:hypothetical protein